MSIPLSNLSAINASDASESLGDVLARHITDSGRVSTFLDCIPSTSTAAVYAPSSSRIPLRHSTIHSFISNFALPHARNSKPLGPNDRIMVVLPTGPANALALLALASYHTCAPVNASCTASELQEDAERLGAKLVFATRDVEERLDLRGMKAALGIDVVYLEERLEGECGLFDMKLIDEDEAPGPFKPSRLHNLQDQSLVLHTSGTSGKKKVVPYALRTLIVGTCAVIKSWDIGTSDVNMNMMPLFHVGGIVRNLFAPILSGGGVIMCAGFDGVAFWSLCNDLGATWYYAAPTMHHAILASRPEGVDPATHTKIRMICNAAGGLLPSLAVELRDTFGGAVILPSYGMTECMPIASPPTNYALDRPGCSGIACGPYLSIRDPFNRERELPCGQTGAVSVRGLPTFDGYEMDGYGKPLDTSCFSSEGWFDSGDMGYMDEDGYLYITGRSKEIINKGGEVISPFEVEEAIMIVAQGRVKTTLAFAIEHDVLQECIGVVIVPTPGTNRIDLAGLNELLKDQLHPSKWPFAIVFMEDVPKNAAGKPLRIKLGQRLGIGCLSDTVPPLLRHFEAEVPNKEAALTVPIACSRVTIDLEHTKRAMLDVKGARDVALRLRSDGSPEAFVAIDPTYESHLDGGAIKNTLAQSLHDYAIPQHIHIFTRPLPKTAQGHVDFRFLEEEIERANVSSMSPRALVIRDIVAELLLAEPSTITGASDFFLLGGNSLLLGRLAYFIRKETGVSVKVSSLFTNSTIEKIAKLVDDEENGVSQPESQETTQYDEESFISFDAETLNYGTKSTKSRGQNHPLSLIVQVIPLIFFYPLKASLTWAILLYCLSGLSHVTRDIFWERAGSLLLSIIAARLGSRIFAPLVAIAFKWIVIGRYKTGTFRYWSVYHLRWWIVNQALRSAGRGIFSFHPSLEILYYRMLGAKIGKNVSIAKDAKLGEFDLLTFKDGCRVDRALIRGFCVDKDGTFILDRIIIGRKAVVNTYTQIAPGAIIKEGTVYGPHASSHDQPSPKSFVNVNRTTFADPSRRMKMFIAWPIIGLVLFASYIPWLACIYLMLAETPFQVQGVNAIESIILWFSDPRRVLWHAVARMVRAVFTPLIQLILGIIVKRMLGLNKEGPIQEATQWVILRRYINGILLSQAALKKAFDILGTHYEMTSRVWRAMGAKIGKRVYWPGSGIYCPDPELLEIGNDVVFGSRSELFTTDRLGSKKIFVGDGAMIADRCVLLPGVCVGRRTVMGSGSLGRRDAQYEDNSTWMGNVHGQAVRLSPGFKETEPTDTITPFGRAFYRREADFFVIPYFGLVVVNVVLTACSAAYWSIAAVGAAQILRQVYIHMPGDQFSKRWYQFAVVYGFIGASFVAILTVQALLSLAWVILTKWIIIGRRKEGSYHWDKSSYCQRWQLHLVLSKPLFRGFANGGVLAPITGSAYIVWYLRALGATIGKDCAIFAGGKTGLMTEPDLVTLGDNVSLDDCSVVAHINSRGQFALNALKIGNGCAMRTGSRLLSGASMEESSMLLEHTLLPSGDIAEAGSVYYGWPSRKQVSDDEKDLKVDDMRIICPLCRSFPRMSVVTTCGHVFCDACIKKALMDKPECPVCHADNRPKHLSRMYLSFRLADTTE